MIVERPPLRVQRWNNFGDAFRARHECVASQRWHWRPSAKCTKRNVCTLICSNNIPLMQLHGNVPFHCLNRVESGMLQWNVSMSTWRCFRPIRRLGWNSPPSTADVVSIKVPSSVQRSCCCSIRRLVRTTTDTPRCVCVCGRGRGEAGRAGEHVPALIPYTPVHTHSLTHFFYVGTRTMSYRARITIVLFLSHTRARTRTHTHTRTRTHAHTQILYTIGGVDNFITARAYFAHSLHMQPQHNLRALYGLTLCCRALTHCRGGAAANVQPSNHRC